MSTLTEPQAGFEDWRQSRLDEYEAQLDADGLDDWKRSQPPEAQAALDKEIKDRKQFRMDERKARLKGEWMKLIPTLSEIPQSPCRAAIGGSTTKFCDQHPGCRTTGICQGLS